MRRLCNNLVGCLHTSAHRIGLGLHTSAYRIGLGLHTSAYRVGSGLHTSATRIGTGIHTSATRIGIGLSTSASLVCSVNRPSGNSDLFWVKQEIKWLNPAEVGVIKYNILRAKYDWQLEEIEIEELL